MIFHDDQVANLDLKTPHGVQELVEIHLCGHSKTTDLAHSDQALLAEFVEKAMPAGITFQQFNELLLVLNQDRISQAFFNFFFKDSSDPLACTRFRRHQVWCDNGTGGGSWSVGSLRGSSSLKLCA